MGLRPSDGSSMICLESKGLPSVASVELTIGMEAPLTVTVSVNVLIGNLILRVLGVVTSRITFVCVTDLNPAADAVRA